MPGRFNNSAFAACYTAKERGTCITEKEYYLNLKGGAKGFKYVIFSLSLTGSLVDLRNTVADGRWTMPEEHDPCRTVGEKVYRLGFVGVAASSARAKGGNCCAVFIKKALESA